MISRIVLTNWKSHAKSEFNFSQGTNVLVGIMGSGKSSVMDAICFALFGTFPDLQNRKVKLDDVIMNKPKKRDQATVELTLDLDKEYTILRTVERGKGTTTSEIRQSGKLIEAPQANRVTDVVEHLLKVDYELFSRAIYSEQNQLDYFLTIPRGQRMKKIDELLRLDKFEKARTSSTKLVNRCRQTQMDKKDEVDRLKKEGFLKKIPEVEKELNELVERKASLETKASRTERRLKESRKRVEVLEETAERVKELEKELSRVESSLEETNTGLKKLQKILGEDAETPIEVMEDRLHKLTEKGTDYQEGIANTREKLESLQKEASRLLVIANQQEKRLRDAEEQANERKEAEARLQVLSKKRPDQALRQVEKKIRDTQRVIDKNQVVLEQMSDSLDKLSGKRCPVCDTPLTGKKREELVKDRERRISEAQKANKEAKLKLKKLEEQRRSLEQDVNTITVLSERFKSMKMEDTKTLSKELDDLMKQRKNVDSAMAKTRKDLQSLEKAKKEIEDETSELQLLLVQRKEFEERLGREKAYHRRKKRLEEELKTLDYNPNELRTKRAELQKIIAEKSRVDESLRSAEDLVTEKRKRLDELRQRQNLLSDLQKEFESFSSIIDFLRKFNQALLETQEQLRTEFVEAINETMDQVWSELYPYEDFQSIRFAVEGGDYVLQLQSGESWVPVEGVTSGGERSSAALCLRIAFALVLAPNLKWLILDEPTHNLDANAISSFAEVLKTRVSEIVDQVFVITHEERLEEAVTGVLYHLKRDKTRDAPTEVEASGP